MHFDENIYDNDQSEHIDENEREIARILAEEANQIDRKPKV
ncbi:MAG: hypothetical protein ACK521_09370 [bacterium]|jgi:hypothetical protein